MPGFSELLGYTSIACWLGAQFPQVLENIRRQSCEGLALPFIANWFLGDFSNLVGCILTHQLPFQTWLATYFVCVDLTILIQYFYYKPPKQTTLPTPYSTHTQTTSLPGTVRRLSIDRGASRYRTLSVVAANVAAAAALAAQQDEETARHHRHESDLSLTSHIPLGPDSDHEQGLTHDTNEDSLAALADSFHSEGGRDIGRKRVSWSVERHGPWGARPLYAPQTMSNSTTSIITGDYARRGRSLERGTELLSEDLEEAVAADAMSPPSTHRIRRDSRAGRKSATMVFLGAWALFGVGSLAGSNRGMPVKTSMNVGRVLVPQDIRIPIIQTAPAAVTTTPMKNPISNVPGAVTEIALTFEDQDPPPNGPDSPNHNDPPFQRILGRIFAWLCATLYLTSRLPQIWKNYARKSVEGLSMYLFVFAFLGNTFYVSSILFSPMVHLPAPASTDFIRESIPYLIGSAGTLIFDVIIVTQSFLYRPKSKHRRHRSHSNNRIHSRSLARSRSNTTTRESEEREGLLAGDAMIGVGYQSHSNTNMQTQTQQTQNQTRTPSLRGSGVMDGNVNVNRGRTINVVRSVSTG